MRPDEDRPLTCKLTEEEVDLKGRELAVTVQKWEAEEDLKSEAMTTIGARIKSLQSEAKKLHREVNSKTTVRNVIVTHKLDDKRNPVNWLVMRTDTFEIIGRIPVTAAEKLDMAQQPLNYDS